MRRPCLAIVLACLASAALAQSSPPAKKPVAPAVRAKSSSPVAVASAASRPSVCVDSNVGHKFEIFTIGLTVFGNSLATADISAWGLDDLLVRKVGTVLGGHFTVRRLVLGVFEGGPLFRDVDKEFLEVLKASAARAPTCDYFSRFLEERATLETRICI